jgi:phytoene synthase
MSALENRAAAPDAARTLRRSRAYCERLARRHAANFYHGFRLLPEDQRQAMCALYSFLRVADDLADGPGDAEDKRVRLADWRGQLDDALAGRDGHPLHPALRDALTRFAVPRAYLDAALDGVGMDLEVTRYETFTDLYAYCYRVASAVGLACIHIWGFDGDEARVYAEAAGVAFQLTNILRDLGEDAARGRVYLPREDLERFGCDEASLGRGVCDERFRALMRFQAARAYSYYEAGLPLAARLRPPGRAVFLVMLHTYRGLLDAIVRRGYDVFRGRVRLSAWRKLWLTARALPVCWGWA